jgi:hypothetical protein
MTPSHAVETYGTIAAAARALGVPRETLRNRYRAEQRKGPAKAAESSLTFPTLPDRNEPIEKLLKRCEEHYLRERNYRDAATWQKISVTDDLPIGVALMGDPHLDDPGCNYPLLRRDVEIIRSTPGCFALNVGDYQNSWVGRLARLFGNQETSQSSARRLIEWLLFGSGMKWLAVITGNHDAWLEGEEILRRMCANRVDINVHEWQAKLELVFPNGATCRINAAHDFKGRSIYSPLHGLKREAIWFQDGAHLAVAGHIHYGGIEQCEVPGGHNPWLVRVRGYKEMDPHALVNGFHEGKRFPSAMAIIDPQAAPEDRVLVFGSLAQGAAVLSAMRSERAAPRKTRRASPAPRQSSKSRSRKPPARKQSPQRRGASSSRARSNKRAA